MRKEPYDIAFLVALAGSIMASSFVAALPPGLDLSRGLVSHSHSGACRYWLPTSARQALRVAAADDNKRHLTTASKRFPRLLHKFFWSAADRGRAKALNTAPANDQYTERQGELRWLLHLTTFVKYLKVWRTATEPPFSHTWPTTSIGP